MPSDPTSATATPTRFAGLDGLRALAVGLVVVYHLFPASWIKGGFIGVDVFFVISGFLITSLLLRPESVIGTAGGLVGFWRRRARRLLPAIGVLLLVCGAAAWLIGGDVLVRLGPQIIGAVTFSYNWVSIGGGGDYFSAATPELFRNLWSLAVEEQFYVVWPLLLPLVLLIRPAWARAGLALIAAGASAAWMAVLIDGSPDPTRAYFGTDSHAFGILIGVALAFLVQRMPNRAWMRRDDTRLGMLVVGLAALVGIGVLALLRPADTTATFPGTLLAASALTAVAIFAAVWPGSWFGRGMDAAPLKWIGDRSYGIYLWHWPVLVLLMSSPGGGGVAASVPVATGFLALAITLVAAIVSYRFLEQPIRRRGFRATLRRVGSGLTGTPATRFAVLALLAFAAAGVAGTAAAVAAAPARTSAEEVIRAGQERLDAETAAPSVTPTPTPTPEPSRTPTPTPRPSDPGPVPSPTPTPVTGAEITAIGDSVMLASAPSLFTAFPGIHVDATVSRSMWAGPGIAGSLDAAGQLRPYVVVALGTNGPVDQSSLDELARIVGPDRHLVLVNTFAPRDWIPGVNAELADFAASHPGVVVADWSAAIAPRVDLLAGDQIHPGTQGGDVFAATVGETLTGIEEERTQREYARLVHAYLLENGLLYPRPE